MAVYCAMGYILGLVLVLIVVPLLMLLLTRRTSGGGGIESVEHGITPDRPTSDQPTPPAGPGRDDRIPPG